MALENDIFESLLNHTATIRRPIWRPAIGSPYSYHPLDYTFLDYSGNSRALAPASDATRPWRSVGGQSGNSYYFDSSNDYLARASAGVVSFTVDYTISVWVNPDTFPAGGVIYMEADPAAAALRGFALDVQASGAVRARIINSAGATVLNATSTTLLSLDVWSHLVFKSSAAGAASLYINGAADVTSFAYALAGSLPATMTMYLGGCPTTIVGEVGFNGGLDELTLFASELSAGNVTSIYSGTPTRDASGRPQPQSYFTTTGVLAHFSDHRLPGAISSEKEGLIFQAEHLREQPICVLPFSADVEILDTIVNEQTGVEYQVEGMEDAAGQGQHKRVFLKRFS